MVDWSLILQQVIDALFVALQSILMVVLPAVAVAVVRLSWAKASELWAKVEEKKPTLADVLEQAAVFAVKAAEQADIAGLVHTKKGYALGIAQEWLEAQGIDIDLNLIDAAIEKAVAEQFPKS